MKGGKRGGGKASSHGWGTALVSELAARGDPRAVAALERLAAPRARAATSAPTPAPSTSTTSASYDPNARRSKLEERYEAMLRAQGFDPTYEPLRLRVTLPTGKHDYKPDFLTVDPDGCRVLHEVKPGFVRPKDWMRFELAVAEWGEVFAFVWAQRKRGEWSTRRWDRRGLTIGR